MKRLPIVVLALSFSLAASTAAQMRVDTAGAGTLISQALDHSEVMENLGYLVDVIGPRLTGSPAVRKANEWTAERFRAYGLSARLEPWTFGVTWERGPIAVRLLEPFTRAVTAHSWAWTEGTGGQPLSGPVVRVDLSRPESLAVYRDRVKGSWILPGAPSPSWNPDGPPPSPEQAAALQAEVQRRALWAADTSFQQRQFTADLPYALKAAGGLGTLFDGAKDFGLVTMSGSPYRLSPLPKLVISHEDYALLDRLLARGVTPRLEARVENIIGKQPVAQWNTVAELRGAELPGQVVILGAHLDSWDLGTGTTDNGTGSMVVLEAARVIAQSGLRPRRTIRFILFTGEEEGLLGSRAYAAAHAAEAESIQAVLVLDNGTGAITGQALQGRNDLARLWKDLLAPVAWLGAGNLRDVSKTGTDHLSFIPYGVPAFNFDQLAPGSAPVIARGYYHTHHSQVDTYDYAVEGDLKQAAAVMAVTAWELANLEDWLPRGAKGPLSPLPPAPSKPR
ncbi:MAG: M20/M25/M40 family metallo-hydrolase [Gemmatimonadales bacterium]